MVATGRGARMRAMAERVSTFCYGRVFTKIYCEAVPLELAGVAGELVWISEIFVPVES